MVVLKNTIVCFFATCSGVCYDSICATCKASTLNFSNMCNENRNSETVLNLTLICKSLAVKLYETYEALVRRFATNCKIVSFFIQELVSTLLPESSCSINSSSEIFRFFVMFQRTQWLMVGNDKVYKIIIIWH